MCSVEERLRQPLSAATRRARVDRETAPPPPRPYPPLAVVPSAAGPAAAPGNVAEEAVSTAPPPPLLPRRPGLRAPPKRSLLRFVFGAWTEYSVV